MNRRLSVEIAGTRRPIQTRNSNNGYTTSNRNTDTEGTGTPDVANLYSYADSNDKTGYFLRGRSKNSGYYNLQTTPAANQLFSQLDYKAGRLYHTEGDTIPGNLTWRMYQAGLLETENSHSPLNTLSNDELKETFEKSNEELSLSETDLNTIQSFIESYSGTGKNHVAKLESLLDIPANKNTSTTDSNSGFDLSDAIETEQRSIRVNAAGTSFDEIQERVEELEGREKPSCNITVDEIASYPSGAQSFTRFWEHPSGINSTYGADFFGDDAFHYSVHHSTDFVEDFELSITDYTILDTPDGLDSGTAGSFSEQAIASRKDCDYVVESFSRYDPHKAPGDEEFTLYLGERPTMTHRVEIDDGDFGSWTVAVTGHEWSRSLRVQAHREAGEFLSVVLDYFDGFDGDVMGSVGFDYSEISIEFIVVRYTEEQKENLRDALGLSDSE